MSINNFSHVGSRSGGRWPDDGSILCCSSAHCRRNVRIWELTWSDRPICRWNSLRLDERLSWKHFKPTGEQSANKNQRPCSCPCTDCCVVQTSSFLMCCCPWFVLCGAWLGRLWKLNSLGLIKGVWLWLSLIHKHVTTPHCGIIPQ